MTEEMRDVFAGLAMLGLLAANPDHEGEDAIGDLARTSYTIADAMIKARDITED